MPVIPKFTGKIEAGLFVPDRPTIQMAYLTRMEGQRITATYEKPRKPKTNPQIRYVHGVVFRIIADECGYDTFEPIKEYLKGKYLDKKVAKSIKRGKEIEFTPSLASLTKEEMMIFIDKCITWSASELGIVIPDAGEVVF